MKARFLREERRSALGQARSHCEAQVASHRAENTSPCQCRELFCFYFLKPDPLAPSVGETSVLGAQFAIKENREIAGLNDKTKEH